MGVADTLEQSWIQGYENSFWVESKRIQLAVQGSRKKENIPKETENGTKKCIHYLLTSGDIT